MEIVEEGIASECYNAGHAGVAELVDLPAEVLPWWRNGIRARLKIAFPQGIVGSSPTHGTNELRHVGRRASAFVRLGRTTANKASL